MAVKYCHHGSLETITLNFTRERERERAAVVKWVRERQGSETKM